MKKKVITLFFSLLLSISFCYGEKSLEILSSEEIAKMQYETEEMIDNMEDGLQDKLSDALNHAYDGHLEELQFFRNKNINVDFHDLCENNKNVEIEDYSINVNNKNINLRLFKNSTFLQTSNPLLVYFHGGGLTFGSKDYGKNFCLALASNGNINVLSVDFSLFPENNIQQICEECVEAVKFAFENSDKLCCEKNLISLAGEGAGAFLALETLNNLSLFKEEKNKSSESDFYNVKSLILYYPLLYSKNYKTDSWRKYGRGYGFDSRVGEIFYNALFSTEKSSLVSEETDDEIKRGEDKNVTKILPPILLISAERDIVFDAAVKFNNEIKESRVEIDFITFKDAIHGFISYGNQKTAFCKAVALTEDFLKK